MNRREIEEYTEKAIAEGRSHQQIFNEVVQVSDLNIHHIANVVRRVPTLEKRKKHHSTNLVLLGILGLGMAIMVWNWLAAGADQDPLQQHPDQITAANEGNTILTFITLVIVFVLMMGIYNYKRNSHLIASLVLLFSGTWAALRLIWDFNALLLIQALVEFYAAAIAIYLSTKLAGDYSLNKELLKEHPEQRVDSLLFRN